MTEQERPSFTSGPWKACKGHYEKPGGQTLCKCGQVWSTVADKHVATAHRFSMAEDMLEKEVFVRDDLEAEANARLISAAPAMYDLLASIENDAGQVPEWLWNRIQDVLSKARGGE